MPEPDWDERAAAGFCPWCGEKAGSVLCDGCKFEICNACNYPCACGHDDEEAPF